MPRQSGSNNRGGPSRRGRPFLRGACVLATALCSVAVGAVVAPTAASAASRVWVRTFQNATGVTNPSCFYYDGPPGPIAVGCDFGGKLYAGRNYVYCKVWGGVGGWSPELNNHWWLKTDVDSLYAGYRNPLWVNAFSLTGPKNSANDTAFDENGNEIPNC